jgi:hypothetical protein
LSLSTHGTPLLYFVTLLTFPILYTYFCVKKNRVCSPLNENRVRILGSELSLYPRMSTFFFL